MFLSTFLASIQEGQDQPYYDYTWQQHVLHSGNKPLVATGLFMKQIAEQLVPSSRRA
jgi:hypothetical protein